MDRPGTSTLSLLITLDADWGPSPSAGVGLDIETVPSRLPWAELFRRVFRQDLEVCPRCAGDVRVLAAITDPDVITAILDHLDLPTEPPSVAPARAPPQLPFWPDGVDPVPDLDAFDPA